MVQKFGTVLVTHGDLGRSLLDTCRMITGECDQISWVSVGASDDMAAVQDRISKAIEQVRGQRGVILLVDMFGGTPSNISLSFLSEGEVEVVTGVNLPMLTKLASLNGVSSLREVASLLRDYGREHIKVAAEYLSGK